MSALKRLFSPAVNQHSPVLEDLKRVVNYDEDGNEYITWQKVNDREIQLSLGDVRMWSLDALLRAGVNPNFPIHTGLPTRLEGIDYIQQADSIAEALLAEDNANNN